jgi:hypothetical protein
MVVRTRAADTMAPGIGFRDNSRAGASSPVLLWSCILVDLLPNSTQGSRCREWRRDIIQEIAEILDTR